MHTVRHLLTFPQVVAFFQEQGLSVADSKILYRELYQTSCASSQQQTQQQTQQPSIPSPAPHTLEVGLSPHTLEVGLDPHMFEVS
jgi:hypothetical protein